jgi:hypothetical protein
MLGLRSVGTTGPLDHPGSELRMKFDGPFRVACKVIDSEPGLRHQVRAREMLGLVTCTTTATLEPIGPGTRPGIAFDYVVLGGPLGRRFDDKVGDEMTGNATKEYARLKSIAETPA